MIHIRRLPWFVYHNRFIFVSLFALVILPVYYLFRWGVFCTNFETKMQISNLCETHKQGIAVGMLCKPLCINKEIHSPSCHTFHAGKDSVFSTKWENTIVVFKLAHALPGVQNFVYSTDKDGHKHYPTNKEFESMVSDMIFSKLNITASSKQLRRLTRFGMLKHPEESVERRTEMQNIWMLIQDQEYLCSALFSDKEMFPYLLGSCGPYYGVEYITPLEFPAHMFRLSEGKDEWLARIKLAIMIMDLLDDLDSTVIEPFHLCDVKMEHFGLSKNGQKVKFLDMDVVHTRAVINRITADNSPCTKHEDCDYFDCRSRCNLSTNKCDSPVTNNNIQVVCEKIFLGYIFSGKVIYPGLLVSQHTPSSLSALLRLCADPESTGHNPRVATPEDIRRRLYITLTEMDHALSNQELL